MDIIYNKIYSVDISTVKKGSDDFDRILNTKGVYTIISFTVMALKYEDNNSVTLVRNIFVEFLNSEFLKINQPMVKKYLGPLMTHIVP